MTPAQAIASLDSQLTAHGQDVILRKTNSTAGQAPARAFVRGYKPDELIGLIKQGDKMVTVSPTSLSTFGEPQGGHLVIVDGKPRTIQGEPELIRIAGVLVRVNMTVRG